MLAYKYLFDVRKIGRAPSPDALVVPPDFAAPAGCEIVPRPAARALAAYVSGLRQEAYLFEAPPPPGSPAANALTAATNAPAGETNAPSGGTNSPAAGGGVPALPGGSNAPAPQTTNASVK
jgi:hypothetical protein